MTTCGKPKRAKQQALSPQTQRTLYQTARNDRVQAADDGVPNFAKMERKKRERDVYGNYKNYYGSQRRPAGCDRRLECLSGELFAGRDVLDVGCNEGVVSLSVWARFAPRTLIGLDLDESLLAKARRHCDDYRLRRQTYVTGLAETQAGTADRSAYRAMAGLSFEAGNAAEGPERPSESADVVLLLSVTKWIQLHHGDAGLREAFARCWRVLRPGGTLVLEPQPIESYGKHHRKRCTPLMTANRKAMLLLPDAFPAYLCEHLGFDLAATHHPESDSKGFRRPLYVFVKK